MRLNKQICVGILSLLPISAGLLTTSASAQLRTGREQRTLYHDQLISEKATPATNRMLTNPATQQSGQRNFKKTTAATPKLRGGHVAQAAYAQEAEPAKSILEEITAPDPVGSGVTGNPLPPHEVQPNHVREGGVVHAPVVSDGDLPTSSYSGCSCGGGCGGLVSGGSGCNSGCDDFGNLAPTCSAACGEAMFSGCGPLANVLSRLSVRGEVPLYWRRAGGPPALATTSPAGTAQDLAGELGRTTTQTLFGNGRGDNSVQAGFRITLGTWLGQDECYGLLFRYWNAGDQDDSANFSANENAILARPFLNTTTGTGVQDTQLVAFPGQSTGNIAIASSSQVDGLNIILRKLMYRDRFTRVDWLYGYQYVSIDESLSINSNTLVTGNANPALNGAAIAVSDRFATQNDFHGATYGLMGSKHVGCWKFDSMFRLGLGNLRRQVNVNGSTTTTSAAGAANTEPQGLLARNTNNQPFEDDTFIVLPEVGFNAAYRLRPGLDFNLGYNYMLIPKVAQASRQIDKQLAVNLSDPLTGSLDPQLDFEERKYWLHSLGLGLQWNY